MRNALLLLVFFSIYRPSCPQSPRFIRNGWELTWSDEFSADRLDTACWGIFRQERRDGFWTGEAVNVAGGKLVILVYEKDGRYFSGAVHTENRFSQLYGYWEVCCRLPGMEGHWPAFWLQPSPAGEGKGSMERGAEIDIMEYHALRPDSVYHAVHRGRYAEEMMSAVRQVPIRGNASGFHTFGVRWGPEKYVFFVDGRRTWTCRQAVSGVEQFIILSEEIGRWAGDIGKACLPDSLVVDYVRVYKR